MRPVEHLGLGREGSHLQTWWGIYTRERNESVDEGVVGKLEGRARMLLTRKEIERTREMNVRLYLMRKHGSV